MIADIDLAKGNVENIIKQGGTALTDMMELAKASESPNAYVTVAALMKTLLDANKDYVNMSNRKHEAKTEANGGNKKDSNVTNNNLIISTAEMLKMIKGENK
jgi:hypothetical protein